MLIGTEDESVISLRRVRDRHFHELATGHVFEGGHRLPRDLIREIVSSLLDGVFDRVTFSTSWANSHHLTVRISPLFYSYVTATTEYCLGLGSGHADVPKGGQRGAPHQKSGVVSCQ